jgi:NAD(P)H dehydrogenase (quinone)
LVVGRLKEKLASSGLVAIVRNPAKVDGLGIAARLGDYDRPDTLEGALSGIDTLLLISASDIGKRAAQHRNVIGAAIRNRVKRIIYTSLLHADTSLLTMLSGEHLQTEALIKSSGMRFTVLRNGWYSENYAGAIGPALGTGTLVGCVGEGKISSATRKDYAEAAVAVLTSDGHDGKTYELAGDVPYTLSDLAAEVSKQTGRSIPYKNLAPAEYAVVLVRVGLPAAFAETIASMDVAASKGALFDDSRQLSKLIGRPTTPLSAVVADTLKALQSSDAGG